MREQVVVASHRRSGTHLTIDAITNNFLDAGEHYVNIDQLRPWSSNHKRLRELEQELQKARVLKTHINGRIDASLRKTPHPEKAFLSERLENSKVIYVHRDGRDVMVSMYHYIKSFNDNVSRMSFSDFIRMKNESDTDTYEGEMNRVEYWRFHVNSWLKNDALFISFRDWKDDIERTLKRIENHTGLQPGPAMVNVLLTPRKAAALERRSEIRAYLSRGLRRVVPRGLRDFLLSKIYDPLFLRSQHTSVDFRKGERGEWRSHFTGSDLRFFNDIAGELQEELGYR